MYRLFFIFLIFYASSGYGQGKKRKAASSNETTTVGLYFPSANKYSPKAKRGKSKKGISRNAQHDFYEQRKTVFKQKRKAERILESPDHSNTTYFGHKRPPKKRKPEDMKLCKVCGIRH